jgi:hypothetical protein
MSENQWVIFGYRVVCGKLLLAATASNEKDAINRMRTTRAAIASFAKLSYGDEALNRR